MQNADRLDNLEQFSRPANDNAYVVNRDLEKGHYTSAERAFQDNEGTNSDAELKEFNRSANVQIRKISPEELPEGEISEEQAESAMKTAGDEEIVGYLGEYKPGVAEINEGAKICAENQIILNDLDRLIDEASKEGTKGKIGKAIAFPFPAIGAIYSILKGRKMKKKLERLQQNLSRLEDIDGRLKEIGNETTLDPDRISPDKGHVENIAGSVIATVGYGAAGASPIGIGLAIGGSALGIYGLYKLIKSWQNVSETQESLEEFKNAVLNARKGTGTQRQNLQTFKQANVQGARENIEKLAA